MTMRAKALAPTKSMKSANWTAGSESLKKECLNWNRVSQSLSKALMKKKQGLQMKRMVFES